MEAIKRVIRFQNYNLFKSVGIFWLVMLLLNIVGSIFFSYQVTSTKIGPVLENGGLTSFAASSLFASLIFFIIFGALMYYEDLAMALSSGVTRKVFYKGAVVSNLIVVTLFAIIQTALLFIEKFTAKFLGYSLLVEFGIFNTSTDSFLFVLMVLFMLFLTFAAVTNLMGILQFRWGYKFWIGFGIVVLALINFFTISAVGSSEINPWLSYLGNSSFIFPASLLVIIMFYTLGYIFIRKAGLNK